MKNSVIPPPFLRPYIVQEVATIDLYLVRSKVLTGVGAGAYCNDVDSAVPRPRLTVRAPDFDFGKGQPAHLAQMSGQVSLQ